MTVKIALLGAGRIGQVHARAIAEIEASELVAVHDPMQQAAESLSRATGATIRPVDEIMADAEIAGIIIATPTDLHADLIEAGARAGKAVFCEKPIDLDVQRVRACLDLVDSTGTPLMVGFNRRFDPHFAELRRRVADGVIGDVEMVAITSRDPGPPPLEYIRRSGGLFRDMMIHDFDMARVFLGDEVAQVTATAAVLVDPAIGEAGDVDSATAVLKTVSGRICTISNSRRATYGYDQRIEVHGSGGMLRAGNPRATTVEIADSGGYRREPLLDFFMERYREAYRSELSAFVDSVRNATPCSPDGRDGLLALLLADAAARSVAEGRTIDVATG
ncbi:MAG: inositol 2-dehydrogenase [Gammaproteobacteria bacterium]|nr:inositol 2-dehydrogenase [Gammaproteobacteria bacterium]